MTAPLVSPAPRVVIGIDSGSHKLGYGIVRAVPGRALACVEAGVITAPAGWPLWRRLATIGLELEALLDEHLPTEAAIEAGFVQVRGQQRADGTEAFVQGRQGVLASGAARGMAIYVLARRGLEPVEIYPATAKKAATGNGAAKKPAVAEMVRRQLGMHRAPEPDAADAIAIALARIRA